MPELRRDPVIGRWVIISTERGKRPGDFISEPDKDTMHPCPFCTGSEDKTPPEIISYRESGTARNKPGWWCRVIPNKFPALRIEGGANRTGDGVYDKMAGIGAHEVIIETPDHDKTIDAMPDKHVEDLIWAYRDRILDLKRDGRFEYVLIFKNKGLAAGATLAHGHSQLIAMPMVPIRVKQEMDGARRYYEHKERCVFCDIIKQDLSENTRLVSENEGFVVIAPYASRFPFETWVLPKTHDSVFEDLQRQEVSQLARIIKDLVGRMNRCLQTPAFNWIIHSSPLREGHIPHYHWHLEVMPKLTRVAGFEWGSGFYINPTPPEEAAQFLRQA